MASQEHLAMLNNAEGEDDDEEDDSSSTTTNSSSSTTTSDDDDDSDDDETSSEDEELIRSVATPATNGLSAMDVSSPILGGSGKPEGSISPSMPNKKRIKLGLHLKTTKAEPAIDFGETPSKVQSETEGSNVGNLSVKLPSETATPLAVSSSPQAPDHVASRSVKKSIKLPLHKALMERASTDGTDGDGDAVVKAMVVESDDGGDDDAVAAVVENLIPVKTKSSSRPESVTSMASGGPKPQRRQANQTIKPVRFPPISSPGLLTTVPAGQYRETIDAATGLATPAAVFDHAMSLVGYTFESRSKKPHRGSSVRRVVDDMFDSNVKFTLNFPQLIPEDLLNPGSEENPESSQNGSKRLADRLLTAFRPTQVNTDSFATESDDIEMQPINGQVKGTEKRRKRKLPGFKEMAPLSLTIPYPEEYIEKRLEYVKRVNEREQAIVDYQEQELLLDKEKEQLEMAGKPVPENFTKPTVVIPPIPEPPSPPRLSAIDGFEPEAFDDMHPFYLPKTGDQTMVAHLDKGCFHIVDGRYFGLFSNYIADPNFVGPNAPGLSGLSLSGGTGLATANTGGGGSSGGTLLSAPSQSGASVNANPNPKTKDVAASKESGKSKSPAKPKDGKASSKTKTSTAQAKNAPNKSNKTTNASASTTSPSKKKSNGPAATATASDLRKIIEDGGDEAEKLKTCIIRAGVYASRCGKHTRNFRAPDGKVYPDISKAFAIHSGIKSCEKCKNNKQGSYHCRLRRKHKELDHDGSDSPAVLAPLFKVPMEDLVIRVIKQKPSGDDTGASAIQESSAGNLSTAST